MSQTTTPPNAPEKVIADPVTETGEGVLDLMRKVKKSLERFDFWSWAKVQDYAINAVAALIAREAALVAEVDLLRRVQASMATEGVALVAERDALIDERDQLNSDYLTAINAANVIAAENKALREALIDVRSNVRNDSPEMWARVDDAIAGFNGGAG